jgi:hypothetical protein
MSLISLQDAIDLTTQFRTYKETILATAYRNMGTLPICETLARADIDCLLAQTECTKLRIYLGMDSNYKVRIVICGVDSNDGDILTRDAELIAEDGQRCPTNCPPASDLNS